MIVGRYVRCAKMTKSLLILTFLTAIFISCSKDERLTEYNQLVNNADSIVFSFKNQQTIYNVKDSTPLANLKKILVRNINPETQIKFKIDIKIELYDSGRTVGALLFNKNENFFNFNSEHFGFGCQLTYGIGRYLEEISYPNAPVTKPRTN